MSAEKTKGGIGETVRTIVYAVLIAGVIRTLAYEPFNIPSESMLPTLLVGDYLFVSKYSYGYSRHSLPWSPALAARGQSLASDLASVRPEELTGAIAGEVKAPKRTIPRAMILSLVVALSAALSLLRLDVLSISSALFFLTFYSLLSDLHL